MKPYGEQRAAEGSHTATGLAVLSYGVGNPRERRGNRTRAYGRSHTMDNLHIRRSGYAPSDAASKCQRPCALRNSNGGGGVLLTVHSPDKVENTPGVLRHFVDFSLEPP